MKPELKVLIIGAGGVASYLLPVLNKTFELSGMLYDADILEEHNLDRQIFDANDIGVNKAHALLTHNMITEVKPVMEYFSEDSLIDNWKELIESEIQLIICVADNHRARRDALAVGDRLNLPVFIAANALSTSQAYVYLPDWIAEPQDPRVRYPELLTEDGGSPLSCQGDAQESTPQLAIANQIASSFLCWLIWLWKDNTIFPHKAVEFQSTLASIQTVTFKDCEK
jgi:molybdopterin/thiamine biosynthesis adenylyltransferase